MFEIWWRRIKTDPMFNASEATDQDKKIYLPFRWAISMSSSLFLFWSIFWPNSEMWSVSTTSIFDEDSSRSVSGNFLQFREFVIFESAWRNRFFRHVISINVLLVHVINTAQKSFDMIEVVHSPSRIAFSIDRPAEFFVRTFWIVKMVRPFTISTFWKVFINFLIF